MQLIAAPLPQATGFYPSGGESTALGWRMLEVGEREGWKTQPDLSSELPPALETERGSTSLQPILERVSPENDNAGGNLATKHPPDLQEHLILAPEAEKVTEIHFLTVRV